MNFHGLLYSMLREGERKTKSQKEMANREPQEYIQEER